MRRIAVHYLTFFVVSIIYISGIIVASAFNTDFGNLDVSIVSIPDGQFKISGLLYHPRIIPEGSSLPAVVLVHGISGSKAMMSDIALELARNGFVAVTIDIMGHGNSEGVFGTAGNDPTLGTLAAVNYIESQTYVNRSLIGLVGHSLGAGLVRATTKAHGNIATVVLIAGGIGETTVDPVYGDLNSTYPKNLLFAVGMEDVLFSINQLEQDLAPVFGATGRVSIDHLYGNFSNHTARKLITPQTTHLFEPVNPTIVYEVTSWIRNSLTRENAVKNFSPNRELVYGYRDAALTISFIALIGLILATSLLVFDSLPPSSYARRVKTKCGVLSDRQILVIWGSLGLILFLPMFSVGSLFSFPPLLFGSSFAWWLFGVGTFGLFFTSLLHKISSIKIDLKSAIHQSFKSVHLEIACGLFIMTYLVVFITENIFAIGLTISVIPVFSILSPLPRLGMFLLLIPFYAIYFIVEGLYLHEFHDWSKVKSGTIPQILSLSKTVGIRICPYVGLLCINYIPMFLLNLRIFPIYLGFIMEFFWGVIPLFITSTILSWWMYRNTSTIGVGMILNTLLFAWSSAAIFPLSTNPIFR